METEAAQGVMDAESVRGELRARTPHWLSQGAPAALRPLAAALLSAVVRLLPDAAAEWFSGLKDRSQQRRAEAFCSSALTPLLVAREAKLVSTPCSSNTV